MIFKKGYFIIFCFVIFSSCTKLTCVKEAAPEMLGDWVHYSKNNGFHYIYIEKNGRGSMYGVNEHDNNQDTQARGWFLENDILYFSRFYNNSASDKFQVNQYPTISDSTMNLEFDTIKKGESYMILNDRYYKKI